jgi:hypothetical protein
LPDLSQPTPTPLNSVSQSTSKATEPYTAPFACC